MTVHHTPALKKAAKTLASPNVTKSQKSMSAKKLVAHKNAQHQR